MGNRFLEGFDLTALWILELFRCSSGISGYRCGFKDPHG
jgi:hypothetical protein